MIPCDFHWRSARPGIGRWIIHFQLSRTHDATRAAGDVYLVVEDSDGRGSSMREPRGRHFGPGVVRGIVNEGSPRNAAKGVELPSRDGCAIMIVRNRDGCAEAHVLVFGL